MERMRILGIVLGLVLIALLSMGYAQRGRGNPEDPRARERVDQLRKMKLIETLGLDEEKSVRFISRLSKHQDEMRSLLSQRSAAIDDLEQAIKDSHESEYAKHIDEVISIDRKITDEKIKFYRSLDDLLTVKQQAKYLVFDRNFNRDLRDMIFETRHGSGPDREH